MKNLTRTEKIVLLLAFIIYVLIKLGKIPL